MRENMIEDSHYHNHYKCMHIMNDMTITIHSNHRSNDMRSKDPEFFSRLANLQTPEYLWIGCSDSRVPANQIVSLNPGEVWQYSVIIKLFVV